MKEDKIVYVDSIAMGDTLAMVTIHPSDSSQMMIYSHSGQDSYVHAVSYAQSCQSCYKTARSLRQTKIFKVQNGFLAFVENSKQGCYFSPTGLGNWYYVGRLGLDHSIIDFVSTSFRNSWAIYYHHIFSDDDLDFATTAFVRLEVNNSSRRAVQREVKIKHNKYSFDRLELVRMVDRGYYRYVAFMQEHLSDIYISVNKYGMWSYPLPLISDSELRLVDVRVVRDRIFVLVLSHNRLELLRLVEHKDSYRIKDRRTIIELPMGDKFLKGCFVNRSSAMMVTF